MMSESWENRRDLDESMKPSACAACGGDFDCGAALPRCWCTELSVTDNKLAELNALYAGCLCRKCLERFAGEKSQ